MIALFDSGYGGLTVLKSLRESLPQYDYLYFGDNKRYPYGDKSQEQIREFSEEVVEYLFERGARLIIFACNTASSNALRHVQEKYLNGKEEKDRKILGVLIPVAEKAAKMARGGKVGLVATRATVESGSYEQEIQKLDPSIQLVGQACPLLVPLIEEKWHHKPEAKMILKKYLRPIKSQNIKALILGCTHYPHMEKEFRQIMGSKIPLIHAGCSIAESLRKYLGRHSELESKISRKGTLRLETTGDPTKFQERAEKYLNAKVKKVTQVEL